MAVSYIGSSYSSSTQVELDASGNYQTTATAHASTQVGDLLILVAGLNDRSLGFGGPQIATPSGWTLLEDSGMVGAGTEGSRYKCFYREAATAGQGSYTITYSSTESEGTINVSVVQGILTFRGHRPLSVGGTINVSLDQVNDAPTSGVGRVIDFPSTTPTKNGGMIVVLGAVHSTSNADTSSDFWTPPSGMTTAGFSPATSSQFVIAVAGAYVARTTGTTGARTGTLGLSSSSNSYAHEWGATLVVLDPNQAPTAPTWGASPVAGTVYNATVPYAVNAATDPDGDSLVYDFERSADGVTWTAVATDTTTRSGNFDSTLWPSSTTTRLRVRAQDSLGATSAWVSSPIFTVQHNQAPTAPTLVAPANGTSQDLAAGFTFDWTPNDPDVGDTQGGWQMRRKISGGAYEYWNASTALWQGTAVTNPGSTSQVTFAASKWVNGNTYNWSVATTDAQSALGPFATDFTVTGSSPSALTVTAPTGTVTTTSRPQVTWSFSDPENDAQQTYEVRIESGAYGTTPGAGTQAWTSGEVSSVTARNTAPTVDLATGTTYRAFVRVKAGGIYTSWAYSTFTVSLTPPSAPTIVVEAQPDSARNRITVTRTDSPTSFPSATVTVDYSDDGGVNWLPLRGAQAVFLAANVGQEVQVYDREVPSGKVRIYRAKVEANL